MIKYLIYKIVDIKEIKYRKQVVIVKWGKS